MGYAQTKIRHEEWDLEIEIQTDHLIPAWGSDQVIINKKENLPNRGLCRSGRQQSENQRRQKESQVLSFYQRTKKAKEHEGDGETNYN